MPGWQGKTGKGLNPRPRLVVIMVKTPSFTPVLIDRPHGRESTQDPLGCSGSFWVLFREQPGCPFENRVPSFKVTGSKKALQFLYNKNRDIQHI